MNQKGFCRAIRMIREDEKLTLKQFAQRSGINIGQLSRIEHGHFPGRIQTLKRIQRGLSLTNKRMLDLLGFHNTEYQDVPMISAKVKNIGTALATAKNISFISDYAPDNGFVVRADDEMSPLIRKGSLALVDRNFKYINGKIYAVLLDHQIIVGRVYKSKGHNYGNLVTNHHSYFNVDYLGRFTVLGQVIKIIDDVK